LSPLFKKNTFMGTKSLGGDGKKKNPFQKRGFGKREFVRNVEFLPEKTRGPQDQGGPV